MNIPDNEVKTWEQLSLLKGGPVELTLRIGGFPEADHAQFQLEARDAGSRELTFLASRPHVSWSDAIDEVESWFDRVRVLLLQLDEPF